MATITTKVATLNLQKRVHFHSSKFHFDSENFFFSKKEKEKNANSKTVLMDLCNFTLQKIVWTVHNYSNSSRLIMTYHFQVIIFKYSIS